MQVTVLAMELSNGAFVKSGQLSFDLGLSPLIGHQLTQSIASLVATVTAYRR